MELFSRLMKRDPFSYAISVITELAYTFLVSGLPLGIKSNAVRYRHAAYVDNTEIHREQK